MAQSYTEPISFTGEKGSLDNAPAYINQDVSVTIPDEVRTSPSPSQYPIPSAPDMSDQPPDYFDISIVPNGAILYYNEVTPYREPSRAIVERKQNGVYTRDPILEKNPDQLWLYFMTYLNEKPLLTARIHGYFVEVYTTYEQRRSPDGHCHTQAVQRTRTITDFNFTFDLTSYITQQWWRVAVVPSKKSIKAGENVSLRDALEQYTRSDRSFKKIVCQKQFVGWDFNELRDKIRTLIYSTGYRNHISVTFHSENHEIIAQSPSNLSIFSDSLLVRVLCFITCLIIIFGPIYLCLRSAGSTRDRVIADYAMIAPIDTFLHHNSGTIVNAAIGRSSEHYLAYYG